MLKKAFRLSKARDVQLVLKRGRAFFSPYFTVKFIRSNNLRTTVVVSKKVSKKAVTRNLIKRIVREAFRAKLKELKVGDWIVMTKPSLTKLERRDLRGEIDKLLTETNFKITHSQSLHRSSFIPRPQFNSSHSSYAPTTKTFPPNRQASRQNDKPIGTLVSNHTLTRP